MLINLLGVRVFGELEFWFSSVKGMHRVQFFSFSLSTYFLVLALIGLLLMGIIIDLGSMLSLSKLYTANIFPQEEILSVIGLVLDTGKLQMVQVRVSHFSV